MASARDDLAGINVKVVQLGNCSVCRQPVGRSCYCNDCRKFVCSSCRIGHDSFTTGHVFTDGPATGGDKKQTNDPKDKGASSSGRSDTQSDEEDVFCETCRVPLRGDCLVKDRFGRSHIGHQLIPILQQVNKVMSELKKKRREIKERIGEEEVQATVLQVLMKSFRDKAAEEEWKIEAVRRELVARRKLVEAPYSDAIRQNQRTARDFSAKVQKQLDDVEKRLKELRTGLKRVDELESNKSKFTPSDVVQTVIPSVSSPGRDVIPPPQLLLQSDVRHATDVGCQVTAACNDHGTVRFRRRVAEIQPETSYFSDESTVGYVPWSLGVYRYSDGRLVVALWSDRHETLSADFEVDVELSGRLLHPTQPEKHESRRKISWTFKPGSRYNGWVFGQWQKLERDGFFADGFLTADIDFHVKGARNLPACRLCGLRD